MLRFPAIYAKTRNANWRLNTLFVILTLTVSLKIPHAFAADPVPVRPGLWEISASGPSISERIKNTPVDKRPSMAQDAGITIRGDAMVRRVCITKEMLARGTSIKARADCSFKQEWKGKVTKISYQCPSGSVGKGELTYSTKESYKGWMESERLNAKPATDPNIQTKQTDKATGKNKAIRVLQAGKWMAKDCAATN
jgi:Protein of unknown function (DUF3617)